MEDVVEVEDTMEYSEVRAMVVDEVNSLVEHALHADHLTIIGVNVLKILHVLSMGRVIAMSNS